MGHGIVFALEADHAAGDGDAGGLQVVELVQFALVIEDRETGETELHVGEAGLFGLRDQIRGVLGVERPTAYADRVSADVHGSSGELVTSAAW
jgi:hypothetical protein